LGVVHDVYHIFVVIAVDFGVNAVNIGVNGVEIDETAVKYGKIFFNFE